MLVAVNFADRTCEFSLPAGSLRGHVLVSTDPDAGEAWDHGHLQLRPNEGLVVRLS
jgi:hypothetical protein